VVREPWRVQFVSKAIAPPFRDGTKCLVRDLCLHLRDVEPHVLGTEAALAELGPLAKVHAVYGSASRYTPTLVANARAFAWLLSSEAPDLFHFVFAPNPRTSAALRLLREWTGVPCVQTIASAPRSFARADRLLCGDLVVAQSEHTAARAREAFAAQGLGLPPIEIIPPPAPHLERPTPARIAAARAELGIASDTPLFVYPGDLEVSGGARFCVDLARHASGALAAATFLVAYRRKTAAAESCRVELEASAQPGRVLFRAELEDLHAVLAAATAVLLPADDLYGKVDLPIVLLEAASLGVPVLVLDWGPLAELEGASHLPAEPKAWLTLLEGLVQNADLRAQLGARGQAAVKRHYAAEHIAARYGQVYRRLLLAAGRC
jgi:hypothetical protein